MNEKFTSYVEDMNKIFNFFNQLSNESLDNNFFFNLKIFTRDLFYFNVDNEYFYEEDCISCKKKTLNKLRIMILIAY